MSGHDPLCQTRTDAYPSWCDCPRVQAIRADELEQGRQRVSIQMIRQDAVDGVRAKAGAWFHGAYETARERHANDPDHRHYWEGYRDALDRAEQDVLALLKEKP